VDGPGKRKRGECVRIVVVSDTHGLHEMLEIPDGDVFVHAGDIFFLSSLYTEETLKNRLKAFNEWLASLPHKEKIVIAGNHDNLLEASSDAKRILKSCTYLCNETIELKSSGLKIFGSPISSSNGPLSINHAFQDSLMFDIEKAKSADILVLHGPPDSVPVVKRFVKESKPRLVIHGHVHETHGMSQPNDTTVVVNATTMGAKYSPTNPAVVIDFPLVTTKKRASL
jgi:Icc-related predicted phosphoesterase